MPTEGDFVKHQIALLRGEGLSIDLVYCDMSIHNWSNLIKRNKTINHTGQCVDIVHSKWFWPRNTWWAMAKWKESYVKEVRAYIDHHGVPDLIHAHTYLGAWVGSAIKSTYNIPLVVTEHYTKIQDGTISQLHDSIAKEAYAHSDKIIAVSTALAEKIKAKYHHSAIVLPNFIDTQLFSFSRSVNTKPSVLKMICVGDLIERKQVNLILEAMKRIEQVELTIIGKGPELNRLIKLSKDLKLSSRVNFKGQKTQVELSKLLPKHDLLIHASRLETFGLVIIEAMASGLPVICFDNGGATDLLTEDVGIIVRDQNAASLGRAIRKMKNNLNDYNPKYIRKQITDRFSPKVNAIRLLQLYTDVIKENNHQSEKA